MLYIYNPQLAYTVCPILTKIEVYIYCSYGIFKVEYYGCFVMLTLQLCYFEELSSTHKVLLLTGVFLKFPNFIKMDQTMPWHTNESCI